MPLALANTSAVPSLWIWPASASDAAKLNDDGGPVVLGLEAGPISSVNAAVSDDAANTVSSLVSSPVPPQPASRTKAVASQTTRCIGAR